MVDEASCNTSGDSGGVGRRGSGHGHICSTVEVETVTNEPLEVEVIATATAGSDLLVTTAVVAAEVEAPLEMGVVSTATTDLQK